MVSHWVLVHTMSQEPGFAAAAYTSQEQQSFKSWQSFTVVQGAPGR
jgi:hypothetical protein